MSHTIIRPTAPLTDEEWAALNAEMRADDEANAAWRAGRLIARAARPIPTGPTLKALDDALAVWDAYDRHDPTPAEDAALWGAIAKAEGAQPIDLGAVEAYDEGDDEFAAWADEDAARDAEYAAEDMAKYGPQWMLRGANCDAYVGNDGRTGPVADFIAAWRERYGLS